MPYYQDQPYAFYYYTENNDDGDSYTQDEHNNLNPSHEPILERTIV